MPKGFTKEETVRITDTLLDQGRRLFCQQGINKTPLDQLVRAAGISKGSFYRFFDSKEALLFALMEQEGEEKYRILDNWMAQKGEAGELQQALREIFPFSKGSSVLALLMDPVQQGFFFARIPPEAMAAHNERDKAYYEKMAQYIRESGGRRVSGDLLDSLFHSLFFLSLHREDYSQGQWNMAFEYLTREIPLSLWRNDD